MVAIAAPLLKASVLTCQAVATLPVWTTIEVFDAVQASDTVAISFPGWAVPLSLATLIQVLLMHTIILQNREGAASPRAKKGLRIGDCPDVSVLDRIRGDLYFIPYVFAETREPCLHHRDCQCTMSHRAATYHAFPW